MKVSSDTAGGTEVVLAVRGPGALLGELSAVDGGPMSATVTALEPVTALAVPPPEFERYLLAHGRVSVLLMRVLTAGCATRTASGSSSAPTTPPAGSRPAWSSSPSASASGPRSGCASACRCRRTSWPAGPGRPARRSAKALRTLREEGWIQTGRLHVIVRDLAALRDRAQ